MGRRRGRQPIRIRSLGDADPESAGQLDQFGPMRRVQRDAAGGAFLKRRALGVAGQEDAVNARDAGRRADPGGQIGRLAQEDIAARQAGRIEDQEEDVVAGDLPPGGLAASSAGEAARPEVEDQSQSEALVRLRAAEREDRTPSAARTGRTGRSSAGPDGPAASLRGPGAC